jgi:ABC-2 type transport system permease protein
MTGTFEALIATPASLTTVVLGSATYDLLYGLATGAVMLLLSVGFGVRFSLSAVGLSVAALGMLSSLAFFAAIGVAVAAFIVVYKQGQAVLSMATSVLGLLGGAFFPVTVFPAPLQILALINPLKWSLDVLRAALLEQQALWGSLALLAGTAAVLLPAALWLLRVAVDRARRDGTLAQY